MDPRRCPHCGERIPEGAIAHITTGPPERLPPRIAAELERRELARVSLHRLTLPEAFRKAWGLR